MFCIKSVFNSPIMCIAIFVSSSKESTFMFEILAHILRSNLSIQNSIIEVYDVGITISNITVATNRSIQTNDTGSKERLNPVGICQIQT